MNNGRSLAWGLLIVLLMTPLCLLGGLLFLMNGAWPLSLMFAGAWLWAAGSVICDFLSEDDDYAV